MVEAGKNGHPNRRPSAAGSAEFSPQLLRTLIHDLRNPLAPLRNAAELLRTLCDDPRQLQAVDIISRQVSGLTGALDAVSRALDGEQSEFKLHKQLVDVAEIVEPALRAVRPAVDQRHQNLFVSLPNESVEMSCDPLRLGSVVQTLLENASAHSPSGGSIALRAICEPDHLQLEIRDDGDGIAPERLTTIFNLFAPQAQPGSTAKSRGLNLAIARQVVEMHAGTIEAFSDGIGRGSSFLLRIPRTSEVESPVGEATPVEGQRILIIEDHEDSIGGLKDVLASGGHAVLTASTGELGVVLATSFKPDAVIVDIGLPGMDGFEVGARLRQHEATAYALLIAVSGFSLKQFKDLGAYSVFRHYLLKPISPDTILRIVEATSRQREHRRF